MSRTIGAALLLLAIAAPTVGEAQVPAISGTIVPSTAAPSYGAQPYNPTRSTGFDHPNQMGFGAYHNPTKLTGPRAGALKYRRFKGY